MLNLDRAETRRAHGMLSAILTASAGQIGKEWFEAMADSPDQASEEFDRHKWINESK